MDARAAVGDWKSADTYGEPPDVGLWNREQRSILKETVYQFLFYHS